MQLLKDTNLSEVIRTLIPNFKDKEGKDKAKLKKLCVPSLID